MFTARGNRPIPNNPRRGWTSLLRRNLRSGGTAARVPVAYLFRRRASFRDVEHVGDDAKAAVWLPDEHGEPVGGSTRLRRQRGRFRRDGLRGAVDVRHIPRQGARTAAIAGISFRDVK